MSYGFDWAWGSLKWSGDLVRDQIVKTGGDCRGLWNNLQLNVVWNHCSQWPSQGFGPGSAVGNGGGVIWCLSVSHVALAGSKWNHRRALPRPLIFSFDSCELSLGSNPVLGRTFLQSRVLFLFSFQPHPLPVSILCLGAWSKRQGEGSGRSWGRRKKMIKIHCMKSSKDK